MERLQGDLGVGHVRYPTVGSGGGEDAQPFTVNYPFGIVMAHNGNVANYDDLRGELARDGLRHLYSGCDVEVLLNVFANALAREGRDGFSLEAYYAAVREVYRKVRGAYSVVGYVAGHGLFAFRDPYGIKPIALGRRRQQRRRRLRRRLGERRAGHHRLRDAADRLAGRGAVHRPGATTSTRGRSPSPTHHPCVFEFVYFARPDSYLEGVSVYQARLRMGQRLARDLPPRPNSTPTW